MGHPSVGIVRCSDYDQVESSLDALLDLLGGLQHYVRPGQRVLLKPNLLGASTIESAVTTHPAVVRAVARRVQSIGAVPFIGDSPAFGAANRVAKTVGIADVAEELGLQLVDLGQPTWVPVNTAQSLPRFRVSRHVLEADAVINLPKLKVHQQMQMSGAVKNLFGCVVGKRKAWLHLSHGQDRLRFGKLLLEYAQLVNPTLTITDAVVAMERMGPRHGDPYQLGLLIGGTDVVALDSVHWAILGQTSDALDLLNAARELGLKHTDPQTIDILGLPLNEARVTDFEMSRQIPVTFSPFRIVRSTLKHIWAKRVAAL